jgi:polyphosphate kinase
LREKLLEMISLETERARNGDQARIVIKCNSLGDPLMIRALYDASQAGVDIQLNIRGICCLKPQVPGLSDRIRVTSVVDRFLEHPRIYYFYHGGDRLVFMSSADLMTRNLDLRVELLIPILDDDCKGRVIEFLELCLDDNVKSRRGLADGSYEPVQAMAQAVRSQEELQRRAKEAAESAVSRKRMMFIPQSPQ